MLKFKIVNYIGLIAFLASIVAIYQGFLPLYWVLIVFFVWSLVTMIGATTVRLDYFYPALHQQKGTTKPHFALTFDDGPDQYTESILALLQKYDAKATFFCIGHKIDTHPELFKRIIQEGHTVGNHTYSHAKNMGFLGAKTVQREIETCDAAAKSVGNINLRFFRSPFGVRNPNIKKALQQTGHQPVGWSIRSFDALYSSKERIYHYITKRLQPGSVVLLHDNQAHTPEILERLLQFSQQQSLKSVTINELFQQKAYR